MHDRTKTFRPQDLWEWLLKFAVLLFTVDVGVRRIQFDRVELLRAAQALRRWILFWHGVPRPPEAEESLAALLARRGQVRAQQTGPGQPRPELFQPQQPGESVALPTGAERTPESRTEAAPVPETKPAEAQPASTASRLLEAKRRAQRRRE